MKHVFYLKQTNPLNFTIEEYRKDADEMGDSHVLFSMSDNGGRRSGIERRRFAYSEHVPERRSGEERRTGLDRRGGKERRSSLDRRGGPERRTENSVISFLDWSKRGDQRSGSDRRSGMDRRDFMVLWCPRGEPC